MTKLDIPVTYDTIHLVSYSNGTSVLHTIQEAIKEYGEDCVTFYVEKQYEDYSDYESAVAYLKCMRPMTPEEILAEKARKEQADLIAKSYREEQYKRLKAEFEGGPA